jgi:hypothetical protein
MRLDRDQLGQRGKLARGQTRVSFAQEGQRSGRVAAERVEG